MYDMYPDAWTIAADRQHQVPADQPRRRARKEHSVVPAILQARTHKVVKRCLTLRAAGEHSCWRRNGGPSQI